MHKDYPQHLNGFFRTNLMVQNAEAGGVLVIDDTEIVVPDRALVAFNAEDWHEVTRVTKGRRILLGFGWHN